MVEEVTIMGDDQDGAGIAAQMDFEEPVLFPVIEELPDGGFDQLASRHVER